MTRESIQTSLIDDAPAWLRVLADIKTAPQRQEVGVDINDRKLVQWAVGESIAADVLVQVADYVASAWHGKLKGRTNVALTFRTCVRRELEFRKERSSNGRAGEPRRNSSKAGAAEPASAGTGAWDGFKKL